MFFTQLRLFQSDQAVFLARTFHPRDIDYVATRAGLALVDLDLSGYDKQTAARHQQLILKIYGFRPFNKHARTFISAEIATMVRSQIKPRLIFWRCVDLLVTEHIQVPNYFPLAELILAAINQRKKALASVIESVLTAESQAQAEIELMRLKSELNAEISEADYYQILEARSVRIQNRISPVLKVLQFQGEPGAQSLLNALKYFKDKAGAIDKHAPLGFLDAKEREAITDNGQRFRVSLYKALLFLHIQRGSNPVR